MKKNLLNFLCLGAIALVSSVGFSACSDKDDPASNENVGLNDGKTTIPVQLVLSVATGEHGTTRMTGANTQYLANSFRGISDASLYSFTQSSDNKHLYSISNTVSATNTYTLPQLYSAGSITDNTVTSNQILELSLPSGTNTLLFYAKAPKTATLNQSSSLTAEAQQGEVEMTVGETPANISFKMGLRMKEFATYKLEQEFFAAIMSRIIISALSSTYKATLPEAAIQVTKDEYPINASTHQAEGDKKVFWADYVKVVENGEVTYGKSPFDRSKDMKSMEKSLADAYYEIVTIHPGEIRAGNAQALRRVVADLWTTLNKIAAATPSDKQDAIAQRMAQRIINNLSTYFKKNSTSDILSDTDISLQNVATIQTALHAFYGTQSPEGKYDALSTRVLGLFPLDYGIPVGATELTVIDNAASTLVDEGGGISDLGTTLKTITYLNDLNPSAMAGSEITAENYLYPAEIMYFGNSPLRVSDKTLTNQDFPDGTGNWLDEDAATTMWTTANGWKNGHVESSTKSVAMKYNINYGTAMMKSQVKFGAGTLKDNNKVIQARNGRTEDDNPIEVSTSSPFSFTGVVIGGQPREVGWNFISKSESNFLYYIYDNDFVGAGAGANEAAIPSYNSTNVSNPLFTLLWDNYVAGDSQKPVYVAVEFKNNGDDFWGRDNLVRKGGTFYIIGTLKPTAYNASTNKEGYDPDAEFNWPSANEMAYPPYDANGATVQMKRVFMQDYTTDVTFVINENSLKNAYVTLPDMRSGQMSLGLSVDISWRKGLSYPNVILDDTNPGY